MYTSSMLSALSMRVAMMRSRSSKIPFFLFMQFCEKVLWQQHQQDCPQKQTSHDACATMQHHLSLMT
jgi:hypothetical protein